MKTILVTGAAGLVGRKVCGSLAGKGDAVLGLDRRGMFHHAPAPYERIPCDLTESSFTSCLPDTIDVIIHLAQSERYRDFPDGALDVFRVNTQSTLELLDYGRKIGINQFVYASSGSIYGSGSAPLKENDPLPPPEEFSLYQASKYAGELLLNAFNGLFQGVVLRPFFIYGPGQRDSMLIPRLITRVRDSQPITLDGDDGILINPVYVDDVTRVIERIVARNLSGTINIGGPEVLSIRRIGEIIGTVLGIQPVFESHPRAQHPYIAGDITKLTELIGPPKTTFDAGVEKTVRGIEQESET